MLRSPRGPVSSRLPATENLGSSRSSLSILKNPDLISDITACNTYIRPIQSSFWILQKWGLQGTSNISCKSEGDSDQGKMTMGLGGGGGGLRNPQCQKNVVGWGTRNPLFKRTGRGGGGGGGEILVNLLIGKNSVKGTPDTVPVGRDADQH